MFDEKVYNRDYYQKHRQRILEYANTYRLGHQDEICEYRKLYGQEHSRKLREYAKLYGLEHKQNLTYFSSLNAKERNFLLKTKILSSYSNPPEIPVCNNCGEQDIDVLCLDHLKGGGSKHRRSLRKEGIRFYEWIMRSGFPKGYQVLCYNCNTKKSKYMHLN